MNEIEYKLIDESSCLDKEKVSEFLEGLLYYMSKMGINDVDVSTGDYLKIKYQGEYNSGIQFEPNYIGKLQSKYIKSKNGTKEFEEEKQELLLEVQKLKTIALNHFSKKINKELMDSIIKQFLSEGKIKRLFETKSVDFSFKREYSNFRLNLSFQDTEDGIALFLSIRTGINYPRSIQEMGINESIKNNFLHPEGLILITGPTGHAKTSTLITMLNWINENYKKKIITIEDPIEFFWGKFQKKSTFRQRELYSSVDSFSKGIEDAVRQNPQIIVIGELRDKKTIEAAIEASLTGHLVIGTLHTSSVTESLNRLLGSFHGDELNLMCNKLAGSLRFVLNQRMVDTIDGKVKIAYEWMDAQDSGISKLIEKNQLDELRPKMYELDGNGKSRQKPLNESLYELIVTGQISIDSAKRKYTNESDIFDTQFKIYKSHYSEETGISLDEIEKTILYTKELEKRKNNKIS